MIKVEHSAHDGKAWIRVERSGKDKLILGGLAEVVLWHNLGYVQLGTNHKWLPASRLLNVGDRTSGLVGDYKITVERVAVTTNKIIKLRAND